MTATITRLATDAQTPVLPQVEPGSVAAQALYHAWAGVPGVVIAAPPGSGKTHTVSVLLPHLIQRAGMRTVVGTQTRTQGFDIANRLYATCALAGVKVAYLPSSRDFITRSEKDLDGRSRKVRELIRPAELHPGILVPNGENQIPMGPCVLVANTRRLQHIRSVGTERTRFDLLVVDEAYQSTWADFRELAALANQYLLVGDPGQIDPVVSTDTTRWEGRREAPHRPAPEALLDLHPDETVLLQLPSTRRCGPATAEVLQPLYPFGFDSTRPDTYLNVSGERLPEFTVKTIPAVSASDRTLYDAIASEVSRLLTGTVHRDGVETPLVPKRIAVGVAHVHQTIGVRARLTDEQAHVTVETLERLQGLEYDAMVLLDPMCGYAEVTEHNGDNGRLCVGLSRHTATCTVITTPTVLPTLDADGSATAKLGAQVRRTLHALTTRTA